jgi:hypothetical protein
MSLRLRRALTSACFILLLGVMAGEAVAENAYWQGRRSRAWEHGIDPANPALSNWYSQPPLQGQARGVPDGGAVFARGARQHTVLVRRFFHVGTIMLLDDPNRYTFDISGELTLRGLGVVNQSRLFPHFIIGAQRHLTLESGAAFASRVAGVRSAHIAIQQGGTLGFSDRSKGGDATAVNRGRPDAHHQRSRRHQSRTAGRPRRIFPPGERRQRRDPEPGQRDREL